jgi:NitT/TauT family transport system permease protein
MAEKEPAAGAVLAQAGQAAAETGSAVGKPVVAGAGSAAPGAVIEIGEGARKPRGKKFQLTDRQNRLLSLMSPILLLVLWEIGVWIGFIDGRFFPPPTQIAGEFWTLLTNGVLLGDLLASLFRIFGGFFLGAIPGLIIGLSMGLFRPIRLIFRPVVSATYPIPKLALMPLILIIFGLGETSKMVTIALGTFFMVLINTMAGVVNLDKIYMDVAHNFGASRRDYYMKVALPGAMPLIFTGLELGMGMALLLIVAAEMNGADKGIGYLIWSSYQIYNLKAMFVAFIVISLLGYVFAEALTSLQRRVVPWKQQ